LWPKAEGEAVSLYDGTKLIVHLRREPPQVTQELGGGGVSISPEAI